MRESRDTAETFGGKRPPALLLPPVETDRWILKTGSRIAARHDLEIRRSWLREGGLFFGFEDGAYRPVLSSVLRPDLALGAALGTSWKWRGRWRRTGWILTAGDVQAVRPAPTVGARLRSPRLEPSQAV